jgi:hypothetical protein
MLFFKILFKSFLFFLNDLIWIKDFSFKSTKMRNLFGQIKIWAFYKLKKKNNSIRIIYI